MYWRLRRKDFDAQRGEKNKIAMKAIVDSGEIPGILAYHDGKPIAWCSLARSRILKPVDEQAVWSVVCLFIEKSYRKMGVASLLLEADCDFAALRSAKIVEGYPVEPDPTKGVTRIV